jgi:hypothetical protein
MNCKVVLSFLLIILGVLPAYARLGETEDQCVARYGSVLKRDISYTTGQALPVLIFSKNGYTFFAILLGDKVAFLIIDKVDKSVLSNSEIAAFLTANSDNRKWIKQDINSTKTVWYRDDGAQAQYDPVGNSLCLITKGYMDAATAAKKAAEEKNLNGF